VTAFTYLLRHFQPGVKESALLVMDTQEAVNQRFVKSPEALAPFQRAIDAARTNSVPVDLCSSSFS
jgi:hypothetical protein